MPKPTLTPHEKVARSQWVDTKVRLSSLTWLIVDVKSTQALALVTPQLTDRQRARIDARVLLLEYQRDLLKVELEYLRGQF